MFIIQRQNSGLTKKAKLKICRRAWDRGANRVTSERAAKRHTG